MELVEGAVPGVELAGMDADPAALVPMGDEASALAVADEVGFEPAGQAMLTGRGDEPVGDQHEGAVGERDALGPPEVLVEDATRGPVGRTRPGRRGPAPRWRHRPTWGSAGSPDSTRGVAGEEPAELGEDLDEEILAAEVGDDALLDLTVLAVGFDDADVFVDGAAGGADFDGSWIHENHYHDGFRRIKCNCRGHLGRFRSILSLRFWGPCGRGGRENKDLRHASGLATPNMG